jgi:hypothetical protein
MRGSGREAANMSRSQRSISNPERAIAAVVSRVG